MMMNDDDVETKEETRGLKRAKAVRIS